jgi:hypothetical protein
MKEAFLAFLRALLPHKHEWHPTDIGMEQCSVCAKVRTQTS